MEMLPAVRAFDAIADEFDARFSPWLSVAAQRRAVRRELADAFPVGSRLLEIGGGTGEDALWLAERGRRVVMSDPSPAMVRRAHAKFARQHGDLQTETLTAETLESYAEANPVGFDGAWSNFAGLNCVADLGPVARGLAGLIRPGGEALLVLFGSLCPGELLVEGLRGRPRAMVRRLARGPVEARLGGHNFTVHYHRAGVIRKAMAPWFEYRTRKGIGIFVPPSAAEPWISLHPRLLVRLEELDRMLARPLALFGDHVLYRFRRREDGIVSR